jgi:Tfp pilus assembly protein PilZ
MELRGGEVVSLTHYSGDHILMGVIYHASGDFLEVIPLHQYSIFNFFAEDPIVLGYKINNEINRCECVIRKVDLAEHHIGLTINDICSGSNQRFFERFPVSINADIQDNGEVSVAFVKNLSIGGTSVIAQHDFAVGAEIGFNLYFNKIVVPVNAQVIWRRPDKNHLTYGLKFIYASNESKAMITNYIQNLKAAHEQTIKRFKTANKRKHSKMWTELNYDHVCI